MTSFSQDQLDLVATALQQALNAHLESLLQNRFADLQKTFEERLDVSLKTEWDRMAVKLNANLEAMQTAIPAKISKLGSTPSVAEPPVLADCSYTGGHLPLRGFIHVMRDTLSSRASAFPDDSARINWVARHFKPIGGSSNNWWMGLLQDNAVIQGVRDHYQFSGLPFITPPPHFLPQILLFRHCG